MLHIKRYQKTNGFYFIIIIFKKKNFVFEKIINNKFVFFKTVTGIVNLN